jgi:hypothetical protein
MVLENIKVNFNLSHFLLTIVHFRSSFNKCFHLDCVKNCLRFTLDHPQLNSQTYEQYRVCQFLLVNKLQQLRKTISLTYDKFDIYEQTIKVKIASRK